MNRDEVVIEQEATGDALTVRLSGRLDGATYRTIRDAVLKAALDEPSLLVIDVSSLDVPTPSAWSVFTSARWMIKDWPEVPLGLVSSSVSGRRALRRNGIARYIPVYGRADAAIGALQTHPHPPRRRVRQTWPANRRAVGSAQRFVAHALAEWSMGDRIATARVVATALVHHMVRHTDGPLDLRLEAAADTVVVAVADGSTAVGNVREDDRLRGTIGDLHIVNALTRVWGTTPTSGVTVVWAVMGPENRL